MFFIKFEPYKLQSYKSTVGIRSYVCSWTFGYMFFLSTMKDRALVRSGHNIIYIYIYIYISYTSIYIICNIYIISILSVYLSIYYIYNIYIYMYIYYIYMRVHISEWWVYELHSNKNKKAQNLILWMEKSATPTIYRILKILLQYYLEEIWQKRQ